LMAALSHERFRGSIFGNALRALSQRWIGFSSRRWHRRSRKDQAAKPRFCQRESTRLRSSSDCAECE
jgi:hypothetical protein